MKYHSRIIDQELSQRLKRAGAVLISGPKACGKTESARQVAKSEVRIDEYPLVSTALDTDPNLLLAGQTPRLIDEWQEEPRIWNFIRHAVDDRQKSGQFILAGSANPVENVKMHSGAGRISRLRMRPMSWFESGYSTGEVSLAALLQGEPPKSALLKTTLNDLIEYILVGGWPAHMGKGVADSLEDNKDYIALLAEVDISRVSDKRRDPIKIAAFLRSYARNIATPATISTLALDVLGNDDDLAHATVRDYHEALTRLMVIEDLPAWNTHLRSKALLRTTPKRHFVDPSLAAAVLEATVDKLRTDLVFLGFLFESETLRDLRVYAQGLRATIAHYRDSKKRESDIILQLPDGSWAAFEVKLGFGQADEGAASLLRVAKEIDEDKAGRCLALTVITGFGFAHRRPDGVNVVPLATLCG
jgi:predicted AAA+ superfamily ATPase